MAPGLQLGLGVSKFEDRIRTDMSEWRIKSLSIKVNVIIKVSRNPNFQGVTIGNSKEFLEKT